MIKSGELFLLNGETGGELRPLPSFLNKNVCVIAANFDRVYIACEPPVCPAGSEKRPCTVWRFQGDSSEPVQCAEFDAIQDTIRQIAIGEKHLLVLTNTGTVYSSGTAIYGSTGHGGARDVPEFKPVPALKDRKVKFVAAGPYCSIAITHEGDIFSWGQAFKGETGLFGQVEAVPRFAPEVTKLRVIAVSCGHAHAVALTETQQCVTWGENTCGQLGLGQKSKPTYKPQLLNAIPSRIRNVSAGWAHSVAVGSDGRVFSWGLNSHGQLGLGDTNTRLAPHLLQGLVGEHQVESAHGARALTVLRAADSQILLCGRIPCLPHATVTAEFHPRWPGDTDPAGCLLVPVPLTLAAADPGAGASCSQLSRVVAFDRGAVGLARSTVWGVAPNLAPLHGGTLVKVRVTGMPFEHPEQKQEQEGRSVQDTIPLKVRLKSASPFCDCVVDGSIVDVDTVEFTTPSVMASQLGSVVEQGFTSPVELQVSIDDGFTWTPDRHAAPVAEELDQTLWAPSTGELKEDLAVSSAAPDTIRKGSAVLWYCRWPEEGPSHVEPRCAPVSGGTELLMHVDLPQQMPADHLTVKFVCDPLYSIGDPELERSAPMRRDAKESLNPCQEEIAKLPLAGVLEVPVCAWLDQNGQGVRCASPPLDAENVQFYSYSVHLSLDGCVYLERCLPFSVFDLRVSGLDPSIGPLLEQTRVAVKTTGLVETDIMRVRVDFPGNLGWPSRILPASFDHTSGGVCFAIPDLVVEVRRRVDEAQAVLDTPGVAEDGAGDDSGETPEPVVLGPDGGLHGVEVCVELSLNGQNFTEDHICFTYYGPLEADAVQLISLAEGVAAEPVKEDPKAAKKPAKGAPEEVTYTIVRPGSKIGCAVKPILESASALLRVELATKVGDEEQQPFRVVDLPARVEEIKLPPAQPAETDPKAGKNAPPEPPPEVDPVEMLTALAPEIRTEELPEGAFIIMCGFSVSLNGQSFVPCQQQPQLMRLEPLPPEASGA